ncbi:hypothetical protein M0805_000721 [Coniferiporia weirii]|nr:hypothetical protein M0805_000721 [Coniferiporia weirii]
MAITPTALDIVLAVVTVTLVACVSRLRKSRPSLPLPPGPRPLPVIQNLLDVPKGLEGPHWAKHKDLYGPISSVSVLGSTIVILNDAHISADLLDKRSNIYSSRPLLPFGGEMVGFSGSTPLVTYGARFKLHRREMHACIGTRSALARIKDLQEVETRRFLFRLLDEPTKFAEHVRKTSGAIILKISHGYTIAPSGPDPLVDLADKALDIFSRSCQAGTWIVDSLPFLRYLPGWIPGMGFNNTARDWNATITEYINKPFAFARHQMKTGNATPSFASELLEKNVSDEHDMKWIAATLYGGGADTSVSATMTFFLAMVLYPDTFQKAQAEIDRVIGRDRLPILADREHLPYVEALEKEVLRWNNVVPMGLPHLLTQDDVYDGYLIPKGAIVLPNIWQMTHDASVYHDPFNFIPERFLGKNAEPDPRNLVFGFGRRICPGKDLADGSLFLSIAMTTSSFNITRERDPFGKEVDPVYEYCSGIISHPSPFKCIIEPRDAQAVSLVRSVLEEHPFESGDADVLKSIPL